MLKKITLFLILLVSFVFTLFFFLFAGIKIDSISFGGISVSQLYLKLDKKLIVDIEQIKITSKKSQVNNSMDDLKQNIKNLPLILEYFQRIDVERLKISGNEFTISYHDNQVYLDNKFINISSKMKITSNQIIFDLYSLYLKDYEVLLNGKIKLDYFKNIANFFGKYHYKDVSGELNLQATKEILDFYVTTTKSRKSIAFVKDFVRLPSEAEAWMYDNVTGNIKLNYLYGKLSTKDFMPILDSFKGNATIKKAKIKFNKKVKPVNTPLLNIDFLKNSLIFTMEKPTYNSSKLYGSNVKINNLTSAKNGEVVVNIKTKESLNSDIIEILNSFDIPLPIIQTRGRTNSDFILKVPYMIDKGISAFGDFKTKDATFKIDNFVFDAKDAKVLLKGKDVIIKDTYVKHKEMFEGILNMTLDTSSLKAFGDVNLSKLYISSNEDEIINLKDVKSKFIGDFNKSVLLDFQDINTKLDINKENILVDVKDLRNFYENSKLLKDLKIKDADIFLSIVDENDIEFEAKLKEHNFPLYKKDKKVDVLNITGQIKNDNIKISSLDEKIKIELKNKQNPFISLKDYDIKIDTKKEEASKQEALDFKLINTSLQIDDNKFYIKEGEAKIDEKKARFHAILNNLDLPLKKDGKYLTSLDLVGNYYFKEKNLFVHTANGKFNLSLLENKNLKLEIDGFDLLYDTQEESKTTLENIEILAKNSNILVNEKHKLLASNYTLKFTKNSKEIFLEKDNMNFSFHEDKDGNMKLKANRVNDAFVNSALDKELIEGGTLVLVASGKDKVLKGKVHFNKNYVKNLAVINNLITVLSTSPALINPLLALPSVVDMASNKGFSVTGYKINKGYIDFAYNFKDEFLNLTKIVTVGNGIDFDGYAMIDLKNSTINGKLNLIFLKGYSKVVGAVPVVNYIILGDNKRVETQVDISGKLDEPKIKTNVAKDSASAPLNIIKRIITSPVKLIESITK